MEEDEIRQRIVSAYAAFYRGNYHEANMIALEVVAAGLSEIAGGSQENPKRMATIILGVLNLLRKEEMLLKTRPGEPLKPLSCWSV